MRILSALFLTLALGACASHLPKPTNANGSVSPSVTVAEAKITYRNYAKDAAAYVTKCHAAPATVGCNVQLMADLKSANETAFKAVNSAETAVRANPAGGTGIDAAINDLNIALAFLQGFVSQVPAAFLTGN